MALTPDEMAEYTRLMSVAEFIALKNHAGKKPALTQAAEPKPAPDSERYREAEYKRQRKAARLRELAEAGAIGTWRKE